MEPNHSRGRSPTQGNQTHRTPQPSPSHYHDAVSNFAGLDPAVSTQTFTTGRFNTTQAFTTPFLESQSQSQSQYSPPDTSLFTQSQFHQGAFQENQFPGQTLDPCFTTNEYIYPPNGMPNEFASHNNLFSHEPMFDMTNQSNINPADLNNMSKMSSPQDHTSPNLLSPENHSSPGMPPSPTSTNGQFYTPNHSRHTSLDPSSAYNQNDWQGSAFQSFQHRRAPSDYSDVSSNAGASPNLGQKEVYDSVETGHSPFIHAQPDGSSTFGIEGFSLGDQSHVSQPHTPYISPRLMPAQNQGLGLAQDVMLAGQSNLGMTGPDMYISQGESTYPSMTQVHARNGSALSDMGRADQFAPPTINIEPAPISRQPSFEPEAQSFGDALSPPSNRGRSKSDLTGTRPHPLSRSSSPAGRSPHTLYAEDSLSVRSHSPGGRSRDSSPGVESGRVDKNRRASTSSINSRDYILDLADPTRPNATPSGQSSRVQKHPATFQCNQCPKRFTRAYNLRSHLRTHTNERPFVCTVCKKAFARQHDRKRHEGLHSGEKKFICRGELQRNPGQTWGCGRRFARADALGRHFRSEAGRICIKPLLDEEEAERRDKMMMEQHHQTQFMHGGDNMLQPVPQPMMYGNDPNTNTGAFTLPAALLAQYPALQNIDWSQVPSGNDDPGDLSDVGYADVPGQGGYYDDDGGDDDGGYVSGGAMMQTHSGQPVW